MTVQDLRELLEELEEAGMSEAEVRIATQPSWPLQMSIANVRTSEDVFDDEPDEDSEPYEPDPDEDEKPQVVWMVSGGHPHDDSPYAPRAVFG